MVAVVVHPPRRKWLAFLQLELLFLEQKLVRGNAFVSFYPQQTHRRAVALCNVESYVDLLIPLHGLRSDLYVLKAVVLVKILDVLCAGLQQLRAVEPMTEEPVLLYLNLCLKLAAAQVVIAAERNFLD